MSLSTRARLAGLDRITRTLIDAGGTVPDDITHLQELEADLKKRRAALGSDDQARDPLVNKLLDGDEPTAAEWQRPILLGLKQSIIDTALDRNEHFILSAIDEHASAMFQTIRAGMFDPAVAALNDLAARVGPTDTVEQLMRAGRTEDALDLANAVDHADKIVRARHARSYLLKQKPNHDVNWPDGENVPYPVTVTDWLEVLPDRQPWLPTTAEVADAREKRRAEHEALIKRNRNSGNVTFF